MDFMRFIVCTFHSAESAQKNSQNGQIAALRLSEHVAHPMDFTRFIVHVSLC